MASVMNTLPLIGAIDSLLLDGAQMATAHEFTNHGQVRFA
jgi:hypothetical protein